MSEQSSVPATRTALAARYRTARTRTERLCAPLEPEDYQLQSMPECSPPKWHLAHTTWFFETFVLGPHAPHVQPFHPRFGYLFNSYYDAVGERWPRPVRGLLSRPTVAEVYAYRCAVDERMVDLIERDDRVRGRCLRAVGRVAGVRCARCGYSSAREWPARHGGRLRFLGQKDPP